MAETQPTAALRIEVQPGDYYVAEPQQIDATGYDYGVLITGHGPATVDLAGVMCKGSTTALAIDASDVKVTGGWFQTGGGPGVVIQS